jgi:hypothetical protein
MGPGLKRVMAAVVGTAIAGGVLGAPLGALADQIVLWSALTAGLVSSLGLALAYGLLPEA